MIFLPFFLSSDQPAHAAVQLYMGVFVYMLFVILTAYTVLVADSNSKNHRIFHVLVNGNFLFCHGKRK